MSEQKLHDIARAKAYYNRAFLVHESAFCDFLQRYELLEIGIADDIDELVRATSFRVENGAAIIPIHGALEQRPSIFSLFFGGVSTETITRQINSALENQAVERIVLDIDSPGGAVDGIANLSDLIIKARETKPIIAVANELAASAAFWLGTAASEFYLGSETAEAGSLGVVAVHRDFSKAQEKRGVKITEVVSGKYKRAASSNAPLSTEGLQELQKQVDTIHEIFVKAVAENRDLDLEYVANDVATGKVFIGADAVDLGIVDGIRTFNSIVSDRKGVKMTEKAIEPETVVITAQYIKDTHPDIYAEIEKGGFENGTKEGAAREIARIKAIEDISIPGCEDLICTAKYDGKSTVESVALQLLQEQKKRGVSLSALQADAPPAVQNISPHDADETKKQAAIVDRIAAAANKETNNG